MHRGKVIAAGQPMAQLAILVPACSQVERVWRAAAGRRAASRCISPCTSCSTLTVTRACCPWSCHPGQRRRSDKFRKPPGCTCGCCPLQQAKSCRRFPPRQCRHGRQNLQRGTQQGEGGHYRKIQGPVAATKQALSQALHCRHRLQGCTTAAHHSPQHSRAPAWVTPQEK